MQDIKFVRDDSAKEREERFKEIRDIIKEDPEKKKRSDIGKRFIYSMIVSVKTIQERQLKQQNDLRMQFTPKLLNPISINKPKIQRQEIKENPSVLPVKYTLLLSKTQPLVKTSIETDEFGKPTYNLIEPQVDKKLVDLVKKKISFRFRLNNKILNNDKYLTKKIMKLCKKLKMQYQEDFLDSIKYYLFRDLINFGKIDSLFHDPAIKQIICDGENKALTIDHSRLGMLNSNIILTKNELDEIIKKIAEKKKEKITKKTQELNLFYQGFRFKATIGFDSIPSKFIFAKEIP